MKKIALVLSSFLFLCAASAQAELKIAVINVETVYEKIPQSKTVFDKLKKEMSGKTQTLQKEKETAAKNYQRLQKEGLTMSAQEKEKLTKSLDAYEKNVKSFQEYSQKRLYEERQKINEQIDEAIKAEATKNKYDLVLTDSTVAYASKNVTDITQAIIKAVSK